MSGGIHHFGDPESDLRNKNDVDDELVEELERLSTQGSISDVTPMPNTYVTIDDAPSPGSSYNQAEMVSIHTEVVTLNAGHFDAAVTIGELTSAVNHMLQAMRDAHLIP